MMATIDPMSPPFFSILLPTYNRARMLDRALTSVVGQTEQNWELLVTDDGSIDGTWASLCDWTRSDSRIRCWRHTNRGQSSSRNRMIEHARAAWIVFLDSDDEFEAEHLARHRKSIEESPTVELWISPMRVVGHPLVPCARRPGEWVHIDHCIGVGMLAVTRRSLLAAGGFPDLDYAEESVLISRLRANGIRQRRLQERTYIYHREHEDAITRTRQLAG